MKRVLFVTSPIRSILESQKLQLIFETIKIETHLSIRLILPRGKRQT